ncbi:hypothetical protein MFIFM68171_06595 [Madurella fahalii]|uniref:Heterokaryon incompatibility domain-containing protein n=1 Tax=Madurella fahalii TaxID=1157608 RepID=A0ABQ0GF35_9PEZI
MDTPRESPPEASAPETLQRPDPSQPTGDGTGENPNSKPTPYRDEDFAFIKDDGDGEKPDNKVYLLPEDQQWAFFAVYLHTSDIFVRPLYTLSLAAVFASWYNPRFGVMRLCRLLMLVDGFRRRGNEAWRNSLSRMFDLTTMSMFLWSEFAGVHAFLSPRALDEGTLLQVSPFLEPVFGPAQYWPHVIAPLLPGLLLFLPRGSVNGFIPESKRQGIIIALFSKACMMILPKLMMFFQWAIFGILAWPDFDYPIMAVEFLLCFVVWQCLDVNIQAAYAAYLFINQRTHWTVQNKRRGAVPSALLLRERTGTTWFAITCLAMRIFEITWGHQIAEWGTMDLGVKVWLPLLTVLVLGIYLLKYGLGIRLHKFKHRPIKERNGIRLLRLHPQPRFRNSPLQCDIIHVKLGEVPPYTAVSHRWGAPGETQEIILIDEAPFLVSSNIHSLLLAKRSITKHVVLWIDSICINQDDEVEKSRQVGMMRGIYEEATSTLGWLGDDTGAEKASLLTCRLHDLKSPEELAALRREKDAGWSELEHMLKNPWFQRIWIIQEVAASTNPQLRYGKFEFGWRWFTAGLLKLLMLSAQLNAQRKPALDTLCHYTGYMNILIMENIRRQVDEADLLRVKDMLKLARGFQATLPVDKVYALLGITDERNAPLFHPTYLRHDSNEEGVSHIGHATNDLLMIMKAIGDILGSISGEERTLRGQAMTKNAKKSARHLMRLYRDLVRSEAGVDRIMEGKPDLEFRQMQANYSEQTTPERVYTVVARDVIRQGDYAAFVAHAGIGFRRKKTFKNLPSWVPDWSTNVNTLMLPRLVTPSSQPKAISPIKKDEDADGYDASIQPSKEADFIQDGGPSFLYLKVAVQSKITHLVPLTTPIDAKKILRAKDATKPANMLAKQMRRDYERVRTNHRKALDLANQHCMHKYATSESVTYAFARTMVANTRTIGHFQMEGTDWDVEKGKADVLRDTSTNNDGDDEVGAGTSTDSTGSTHCKSDSVVGVDDKLWETDEKKAAARWFLIRHMQCSPNFRVAQLILTDIAPSFASYSFESGTSEKRVGKTGKKVEKKTGAGKEAQNKEENERKNIEENEEQKKDEGKEGKKDERREEKKELRATTPSNSIFSVSTDSINPLHLYTGVADYTLDRQFVVTESGDMGLVPNGTEIGDLLVAVRGWSRCFVLRPAVFSNKDPNTEESEDEDEDQAVKMKNIVLKEGIGPDKMCRLVGEAYVHGVDWEKQDEGEWFALW